MQWRTDKASATIICSPTNYPLEIVGMSRSTSGIKIKIGKLCGYLLRQRSSCRRQQGWYAIAIGLVISLGLGSRRYPQLLPAAWGKYPGDALWTIGVFLICGTILPRVRTLTIAGIALLISYLVECGQLYQPPWLVGIRQTSIGHLLLGSEFDWSDLVAYTVGAAIASLGEWGAIVWMHRDS